MPQRRSTVRGREFAAGLRSAVGRTGFGQHMLADMLGWDYAKMSDLMNGKGGVNEVELAKLLGVCRIPPAECDHLMALFQVSREKGWWQLHDGRLPVHLRTLIEHQDAATEIIDWSTNVVPGLLQTDDYIRELIAVWEHIPAREVEQRVEARLAMQKILRSGCVFTFYVHEQALRLPVGGLDVLSEQLHHLLRMSVRPYLTVRVLPISAGAYMGQCGSFTLMKFTKVTPVVYEETLTSSLFLEDKASMETYSTVVRSLDRTALDPEQSRRLITEIVT